MTRQDQVRTDLLVQLGPGCVIPGGKMILINIIPGQAVLAFILVASGQDAQPIHLNFNSDCVARVARQRMNRQHVLFPGYGLAKGQAAVHRDRVKPETGEVIAGRIFQDVSEGFGRPDLGSLYTAQQVASGHMIVVKMGWQDNIDLLHAKLSLERRQGIKPGAA